VKFTLREQMKNVGFGDRLYLARVVDAKLGVSLSVYLAGDFTTYHYYGDFFLFKLYLYYYGDFISHSMLGLILIQILRQNALELTDKHAYIFQLSQTKFNKNFTKPCILLQRQT
jgi:hypothetical protein